MELLKVLFLIFTTKIFFHFTFPYPDQSFKNYSWNVNIKPEYSCSFSISQYFYSTPLSSQR